MAPSRRKGSSKASAAAAAAARRQWKVGDLVLAKVKGFPAWPATVSEPQKWGYSTDWKKVLVYFFGTKQIAFCNPADVEAFTEEKKETLLVKCQGKGADFVRAVQEIIDSYEKTKKLNQLDDASSGGEVTVTNAAGDSVDTMGNLELKDQTEVPLASVNIRLKASSCAKDRSEPSLPVEDAAVAAQLDALHDRERVSDEPTENVLGPETTLSPTYSSRKRFRGTQPKNCVTLKKTPSVRKSRSLSRGEFCRFQSFMMLSNDGSKSSEDIAVNLTRDGSLRNNKGSRKSPVASVSHYVDSPSFPANGSIEDNGSEIVTVESDTHSLNEGSTIESGCKYEQPDKVVECLEEDIRLSKKLDLQMRSVVTKKKRRPNRKRAANDVAACSARLDGETGLEAGGQKTGESSPSGCERSNGRCSKEDGDEHLPLVKRARVRMGKPSSVEGKLNDYIQTEDNSEKCTIEATANLLGQVCSSLACSADVPADKNVIVVERAVSTSSPADNCNQITEDMPPLSYVKKNKSYGCLVDGEAALPPSKRLHRALEAMSANAAEDGQAYSEAPSTVKAVINECRFSSVGRCPDMAMESKAGNTSGVQEDAEVLAHDDSQVGISGSSPSLNLHVSEETAKFSIEVEFGNQPALSSEGSNHQFCKDVVMEAADCIDGIDPNGSSFGIHAINTLGEVRSPQPLPDTLDRRPGSLRSNENSLNELLPSNDEGNGTSELNNSRAEKPEKPVEFDSLECAKMSLHPDSGAEETGKVSPQNGTNLLLYGAEGNCCECIMLLKPQIDDSIQVNDTREVVNLDHKSRQKDVNASPSPTSMKVTTSAVRGGHHISCSPEVSVNHSGEKKVSCIPSSPSSMNGVDCPAQGVICGLSSASSTFFLQKNSYCSPVHLHKEKTVRASDDERKFEAAATHRPKSVGKWGSNADASTLLKFFESMLGTLTRTKESIGRATRIAIDCAKFGNATEVLEILARNLETESRLHRRVDLFFLVDSITQCSRGLKGDGGIYPSIIQAVLPRLLSAAAPPGNTAQENRRQCLKVLRLWLERRILPDSLIRHHIRELDSLNVSSSIGSFSRRSSRTERALNDPLREMEGMLVDEYGSNSSFQLPGFCMPRMLKDEDEGSDSDGGNFEAVTPEHNSKTPEEQEAIPTSAIEKHRHILEDVDGELEMEDVAPSNEVEMNATNKVAEVYIVQASHHRSEQLFPLSFAPPLPCDMPPSSPPLPTSPPPAAPPPPPPLPPPAISHPFTNGVDSKLYMDTNSMPDSLQQSISKQSIKPKINPTISDAVHYHAPEHRDFQMQMQMSEPSISSSFSSFPISPSPMHSVNNVQPTDSAALRNKAYQLRPPHPAPSNQFSYVQADQRMPPRREAQPPLYSNRYHFAQNMDGGNFYSDQDGMKSGSHEPSERWRFSAPSFHVNLDRVSYATGQYGGPLHEPARISDQGWAFPHHGMNHRSFVPVGPPSENGFPVAVRAARAYKDVRHEYYLKA
ncbi:protein HUA2-LIKE 3-like isoform X4 [Malania oleifera]|uniref:protein HUA2-LIKE 3-like isoform X4 n=1 Tax=Malania oleifera TaxID=397392 RepID=UPI0025AE00C6|nr:protein HUA2-LIKE 3-like isoform X4 [Malania oleifera]